MKKAIMFDLDGTLINSLPDIAAAMNRALAKHHLPVHALEKYNYMVGDGVINLAKRAVGIRADLAESVLDAYKRDYAVNCAVHTCPYDGIPHMLHALKEMGLLIFVFSNKDQSDVETVCRHYFPDFTFDAIRGRQENVPVKPAPDGAHRILSRFSLSPQECWYVGDTDTDMRLGCNAGMENIGVLWGFRDEAELKRTGAKYIVRYPGDIITLVKEK